MADCPFGPTDPAPKRRGLFCPDGKLKQKTLMRQVALRSGILGAKADLVGLLGLVGLMAMSMAATAAAGLGGGVRSRNGPLRSNALRLLR